MTSADITAMPWLPFWPSRQRVRAHFPPATTAVYNKMADDFKLTRMDITPAGVTLVINGRFLTEWIWEAQHWRQRCNCGAPSLCIHAFHLAEVIAFLLDHKNLRPEILPGAKAVPLAPPQVAEDPAEAPPEVAEDPAEAPPEEQAVTKAKSASKSAPAATVQTKDAKDAELLADATEDAATEQEEEDDAYSADDDEEEDARLQAAIASTHLAELVVECDQRHSPLEAALRIYQLDKGMRDILDAQQIHNLAKAASDQRLRGYSEDDGRFLRWLFPQINRPEHYSSRAKYLLIGKKQLDSWFETWKARPGRFIDRESQRPITTHCELLFFMIPEIDGDKVRLPCFAGISEEDCLPAHEVIPSIRAGTEATYKGATFRFTPPFSLKKLVEIFGQKKTPTIPLDKAPDFLPKFLEGRLDLLRGSAIQRAGGLYRKLNAQLGPATIDLWMEDIVPAIRLVKGRLLVRPPADRRWLDPFLHSLGAQPVDGGGWNARADATNLQRFLELWEAYPLPKWAQGELHKLLKAQRISPEVHISEGSSAQTCSVNVRWNDERLGNRDVMDLIANGRSLYRTREGDWIHIDLDDLRAKVSLLEESGVSPHLPRQVHLVEAAPLLSSQSVPFRAQSRELIERLRKAAEAPSFTAAPQLEAILRSYQRDGARFMHERSKAGAGVILADDMGLGKTMQTLAMLTASGCSGPALVLCPASVTAVWQREADRFAPELQAQVITGTPEQRRRIYTQIRLLAAAAQAAPIGPDTPPGVPKLLVMSYSLLHSDADELSAMDCDYIILDEAHYIKNPKAKLTLAIKALQARHRIALTGTPLENRLDDLWSIMDFLNPGLFGDLDTFRDRVQANLLGERKNFLRRLHSLMLRRTKEQVATELPPKTIELLPVEASDFQLSTYTTELKVAKATAKSTMAILGALTKLRQICSFAELAKTASKEDALRPLAQRSPKASVILEMLQELIDEGRSVLIFSQFTTVLEKMEEIFKAEGIHHFKITGDTPVAHRPRIVNEFNESEKPAAFLLSLKAAGTGLTLTKADTVFIFDPWWNPAAEAQAIDRTHRIGQEKPVFVYRLILQGSIEEKVLLLQEQKRALFAEFIESEEGEVPTGFSPDQLASLLE